MGGIFKDKWSMPFTAVAHEFIDGYMAAANGEYVKVYLYILRHQGEPVTVEGIADALNHTESDVRRAVSYWEKQGVLAQAEERPGRSDPVPAPMEELSLRDRQHGADHERKHKPLEGQDLRAQAVREQSAVDQRFQDQTAGESTIEVREAGDVPVYSAEQVNRLSQDEEFSQLLYIAQKYMDRIFTPRDCQVFAYLYEELGMSGEVLEYLVEYCVQNGHTSVRYIEAVARNWHEKGIRTVQEAKGFSASYNKDSFAVMKAFGINGRKPAAPEQKLIDKWFRDYGFSREVVLEACGRTITAIHSPSFQYADKILGEWKKSDIRTMADIRGLDARRLADKEQNAQSREKRLQKYDTGVSSQGSRARKGAPNQFHNFEQRDTDYDALMLKQVKEWVGQ